MKKNLSISASLFLSVAAMLVLFRCSSPTTKSSAAKGDEVVVPVNPDFFIKEGLLEPITKVNYKLSDGSTVECYKIVTSSTPSEHTMGPWCPTNINDGAEKGGIWMEGGKTYDVDGAFVKNLATFYKDAKWKMYNEDGSINVTSTKEACEAAARPNVDAAYQNFCVQCLPSYFENLKQIFYIPVTPVVAANTSTQSETRPTGPPPGGQGNRPAGGGQGGPPNRGEGGPPAQNQNGTAPAGRRPPGNGGGASVIGIAFNGVNFDPPAPTADILKHYTLAPLDDNGGHINPHAGYHYHAATGKTKTIKQTDRHAGMIGYAMDGYGIFEQLDEAGQEPVGLDKNRGHYDTVRGYHYHVGPAGGNKFINGFRGKTGGFSASF